MSVCAKSAWKPVLPFILTLLSLQQRPGLIA